MRTTKNRVLGWVSDVLDVIWISILLLLIGRKGRREFYSNDDLNWDDR